MLHDKGRLRAPFLLCLGKILAKLPFDPASMILEYTGREKALPPERLEINWIRSRFANPPEWQPEVRSDSRLPASLATEEPTPASVLIPIVAREQGAVMLMTRRTDHLHDHPGQVSFPGGRTEESDASSIETALRETEEEIGLHRRHVDVIGALPDYITASGYRVTPVVSIIQPPFGLKPDSFEVAEVFEVPLSFLMSGMNYQRLQADFPRGWGRRSFYAIPYEQYFIWGATAAMLRNLFHFLRA
ncbi:MAG: CoA pyrophosphatase [Burkholderiaceae bacterium]|nr:CoA pyrophosphatase [Burkholderiaceae bacterium]